jgi:hypothetical protein
VRKGAVDARGWRFEKKEEAGLISLTAGNTALAVKSKALTTPALS